MARLSLRLLGPLQVILDGQSITSFESNKVRALLAYLAVEADRPHHRAALAALLWPDRPDRTARSNLRNVLSLLRRTIGDRDAAPPFLQVTRETIQFNADSDHWLDVAAFTALVEGEQPDSRRLAEAVRLYRGDFLEGFSLKDSPAFDDWSLLARERLQRQALTALRWLGDHYERCREYGQACDCAWRAVELEPWQEEAQRQLLRLLALSGQRSAALAQYDACRRLLREELGVEPAPETTHLYEQIRDGEIASRTPGGAGLHNLPTQLIPFVGRDTEMTAINAHLRDPVCRLLTLTGPGGGGKTRLALKAASSLTSEARFAHGVYFVSLTSLQSADAILPAVAQALAFSLGRGASSTKHGPRGIPRQQLLDYLGQKNMLLVLDGFEQVLANSEPSRRESVSFVADVLAAAPGIKVLATSRAKLNLQGEYLFSVTGMELPPPMPMSPQPETHPPDRTHTAQEQLREITTYSAVELFLMSARRLRPDFQPTADDLTHITRICHQVQGMPLSILLAAAWMDMLSPAEIANQISDQSLDFLAANWPDVPERQRSMRAVFDHSWGLLTERERRVFAGLSVFRGGFARQAAERIVGASLRDLKDLADRSLLQRTSTGRYELHELLRQYAAEKLALSPDLNRTINDLHCDHYIVALQEWEADLRGPRQQIALARFEADSANVRGAWSWSMERCWVNRVEQAGDGLCHFYERGGRYEEGGALCRATANRLEALALSDEPVPIRAKGLRVLAKAWTWQGIFSRALGRIKPAYHLLQQAQDLLARPELAHQDTRREQAFTLRAMARTAFSLHDCGRARQLYAQSLALCQALGDEWETAKVLDGLGQVVRRTGDPGEARRLFADSLAIRRSLGDQIGVADSLMGLSWVAGHLGQFVKGERMAREAVAIRRNMGYQSGLADGLRVLACMLVYSGRFDEARLLLEEAVTLHEDLGMRTHLALTIDSLGWAKEHLGQYQQAREQMQIALTRSRESGSRQGVGYALLGLGEIALAKESYPDARRLLGQSAAIFREIGQPDYLCLALVALGHVAREMGLHSRAKQHLDKALRTATEIGAFVPLLFSFSLAALLLADQGDGEEAIELYALMSRYPYAGNSQYQEDVTGKRVAAIASTLPSETVTAAQERGRARDLDATAAGLLAEVGKWQF